MQEPWQDRSFGPAVLALPKTFGENDWKILKCLLQYYRREVRRPKTLSAGFTFSLPSSWEGGPIEVRNFNRFRKVYS
jgi:hypothetical protein